MSSEYLPLAVAWERVTGKPSSIKQLRRRVREGAYGVRLESRMIGGQYHTTLAWVEQYLTASTAARLRGPAETPTQSKARKAQREQEERRMNELLGVSR